MSHRRLEIIATVLLALSGVATAWAAYQARQWTGQQALSTSHATAARITENRDAALANRQVQIDVATFTQWLNARATGHLALATFYRQRFRDEFKPAFAAWLGTKPLTNSSAPETPFAMPQYRLTALFFAGISSKLRTEGARALVLGLGCLMFLGAVVWLATLPVN
jgi:hypothetical protein